jgi:tetratricopeptide (TPR) repeat protein
MKYLISFIVLSVLIFKPASTPTLIASSSEISTQKSGEEIKARLEEAKKTYSNYYKDSMNLDRSISMLKEILEKDPKNVEAMILLSRVWLTYGYVRAPNDEEKIRVFKNGMNVAKRAVKLSPKNPDAHFFYVANLGSRGETEGILKSLFLVPEIRSELELILELDPNHIYGLGMTGLLYYTLPSFVGGDLAISEIYLRKAMRLDPNLTIVKIHLAKTLIKQDKYDEATIILKEVIEEDNPSDYADWHINKKIARNLLSKIDKKTLRGSYQSDPIKLSTY